MSDPAPDARRAAIDTQPAAPSGAIISHCGQYRYHLWRPTGTMGGEGTVAFVMLNPSTADADADDPTIRKCLGFAARWGYARLEVLNVYAFRATDPKAMFRAPDPIGPANRGAWSAVLRGDTDLREVVVAWGVHAVNRPRWQQAMLDECGVPVSCMGMTAHGHPRHPLYLPWTVERSPWGVVA